MAMMWKALISLSLAMFAVKSAMSYYQGMSAGCVLDQNGYVKDYRKFLMSYGDCFDCWRETKRSPRCNSTFELMIECDEWDNQMPKKPKDDINLYIYNNEWRLNKIRNLSDKLFKRVRPGECPKLAEEKRQADKGIDSMRRCYVRG